MGLWLIWVYKCMNMKNEGPNSGWLCLSTSAYFCLLCGCLQLCLHFENFFLIFLKYFGLNYGARSKVLKNIRLKIKTKMLHHATKHDVWFDQFNKVIKLKKKKTSKRMRLSLQKDLLLFYLSHIIGLKDIILYLQCFI